MTVAGPADSPERGRDQEAVSSDGGADTESDWREITDGGCVLVRPDKFVGYRDKASASTALMFDQITEAGQRLRLTVAGWN